MTDKEKLLQIIKIIILSLLFYAAVYFENAGQQRFYVLQGIFFTFIAWGLVRNCLKKKASLYALSFILDLILIYVLEYNSRLMINYFFHFFYFILILEAAMFLEGNRGIYVGIAGAIASLIKYFFLIYYKPTLLYVSQMIFFFLVSVLTLLIIVFAQYYKREKEKKDLLYKELLFTHKELQGYIEEVKRLIIIEENNRFARDVHDILGHNMTALIMQLEMVGHILNEDIDSAKVLIEQAKTTARDALTNMREVVATLRGKASKQWTVQAIKDMIQEFSVKTGVKVNIKLDNEEGIQGLRVNIALFRIIQEALTNSVRHGKATEVDIDLSCSDSAVTFFIRDNGTGVVDLRKGYGLKGIKERVEALKGRVEFETQPRFTIIGVLCMEGNND